MNKKQAGELKRMTVDGDHALAASRILTAQAASQYSEGDMTATDEAGHEAIARDAGEAASERRQQEGGARTAARARKRTVTLVTGIKTQWFMTRVAAATERSAPGLRLTPTGMAGMALNAWMKSMESILPDGGGHAPATHYE